MSAIEIDPADFAAFSGLHPEFDSAYRILWLRLDHGKANEMGSHQLDELEALASFVESDQRVRCLATSSERLSSKGKAIFIAGANVTERVKWSAERVVRHVARQRQLMQRLSELPVFTVALTHGVTLGWGAEFLLAMDYAIATPQAKIALPETGLGIVPGAGGTAKLAQRVGPAQALRLGCVGEALNGTQAKDLGLVAELAEDLRAGEARIREMAQSIARKSPTAVAAFKAAVLAGSGRSTAECLALEDQAYAHCLQSGEAALGRAAFSQILAGETPQWGPRQLKKAQGDSQGSKEVAVGAGEAAAKR